MRGWITNCNSSGICSGGLLLLSLSVKCLSYCSGLNKAGILVENRKNGDLPYLVVSTKKEPPTKNRYSNRGEESKSRDTRSKWVDFVRSRRKLARKVIFQASQSVTLSSKGRRKLCETGDSWTAGGTTLVSSVQERRGGFRRCSGKFSYMTESGELSSPSSLLILLPPRSQEPFLSIRVHFFHERRIRVDVPTNLLKRLLRLQIELSKHSMYNTGEQIMLGMRRVRRATWVE